MKGIKIICSSVVLTALSGCSILPYENTFSCRIKDNFGKCMSVDDAYEEAVTGVSKHPTIGSEEKQKKETGGNDGSEKNEGDPIQSIDSATAYDSYKAQVYQELSSLVQAPKTPMLRPTKTIRTWILSYADSDDKKTLYMPRFVYSIIDDPEWVLGDYLEQNNHKSFDL